MGWRSALVLSTSQPNRNNCGSQVLELPFQLDLGVANLSMPLPSSTFNGGLVFFPTNSSVEDDSALGTRIARISPVRVGSDCQYWQGYSLDRSSGMCQPMRDL